MVTASLKMTFRQLFENSGGDPLQKNTFLGFGSSHWKSTNVWRPSCGTLKMGRSETKILVGEWFVQCTVDLCICICVFLCVKHLRWEVMHCGSRQKADQWRWRARDICISIPLLHLSMYDCVQMMLIHKRKSNTRARDICISIPRYTHSHSYTYMGIYVQIFVLAFSDVHTSRH